MRTLAVLFVALLLIGCGGGTEPQAQAPAPDTTKPAVVEISFAKDVQSIVTTSCLPCHAAGGQAAKYDLTKYESAATLVVAGKPDSSKLYQVLNDGKMPPAGKLDAAKLEIVSKWITEGAKNN